MSITIMVKQLSKPTRSLDIEEGTTIREVLEDELQVDTDNKTFTVSNNSAPSTQGLSYMLRDGDTLTISVNNKGAVA